MEAPVTDENSVIQLIGQELAEGLRRIESASSADELAATRQTLLGKSAPLTALKATFRSLNEQGRKAAGMAMTEATRSLQQRLDARAEQFRAQAREAQLESERMDLTEVLRSPRVGHTHLVSQTLEMLEDAFIGMGFTIAEGPEIETDWYNFEALNMPEGHPARSMWDTLYLEAGEPETVLLRTHTSPVQIRTMLESEPPIYIVAPGRTYRSDTADATHLPVFHQIEGLVIDRGITFADLAGTIEAFVKVLYGSDRTTRLRPSFFPFTEPSAEFDMSAPSGEWIELGGCGMVHPNVLRAGGLDPEEWTGFAFGFGLERMAAQRHGLDDIRELVTNDMRFLSQF